MIPRDADPLRPPETDQSPEPFRQHRAITVLAILAGLAILFLAYVAAEASRAMTDTADPVLSSPEAPHRSGGVSSGAVAVVPLAAAPTSGIDENGFCAPKDSAACRELRATARPPARQRSVEGTASWFAAPDNEAAAGPGLRQALGAGWRGTRVRVCAGRCVSVVLTDFCRCPDGKVIDLDDGLFSRLAPLGRGLVAVRVSW